MSNNTTHELTNEARKVGGVAVVAAENLGKELKSSARQVGSAIKDASVAVGHNLEETAHHTYDSIVASGREGAKQIESTVKNSPLLAIGIAFGVGMLTSALVFRKS